MREIDLKMAELNKKFKNQLITQGTDIIEVAKIPFSSPTANYMTYGGIPIGKITEFYGGEGGGKTTSALDICANAQKKFNEVYDNKVEALLQEIDELNESGTKEATSRALRLEQELDELQTQGPKLALYVDAEQTLDTEWAKLLGVDTEKLILVRPQAETAEQVFQIIIDLISTGNVGLCILDSIPMLISQNIFDESLEKKSYGGISQALTEFCRKVTPHLVQNQCAFIGINQIREDLSSMYNTESTPGGKMWKHACSLRLKFKKDEFFDINGSPLTSRAENPVGNKVSISIVKTKVCKPNRRLGYYSLSYTDGILVVEDTIEVAQHYGIINKTGAWYRINDENGEIKEKNGELLKFQGKARLVNYLKQNSEELEYVMQRLEAEMI